MLSRRSHQNRSLLHGIIVRYLLNANIENIAFLLPDRIPSSTQTRASRTLSFVGLQALPHNRLCRRRRRKPVLLPASILQVTLSFRPHSQDPQYHIVVGIGLCFLSLFLFRLAHRA